MKLNILLLLVAGVQQQTEALDLNFQQQDYHITFERGELLSYNHEKLKSYTLRTFKYNRTNIGMNMSLEFKVGMGNELEAVVQAYKFMSNEYRQFPLHLKFNFCEAFEANMLGLGEFKNCGNLTSCPLVKNKMYHVCNWAPDEAKFPPFIPSGKYMLELQWVYRTTDMALIKAYGKVGRQFDKK